MESAIGSIDPNLDLHRPFVDAIKLRCACGKDMDRVEYVIDCWYDSGAATFAQHHYPFENKELFEKSLPYDFICEATDQTRGWFYTLLVLSTLLFGKPAYKSCVVGGLLLDDKGEKMSKSKNNIVDPWQLFNSVGADAVRLQMCVTAPWNVKRFGQDSINESVMPMLRTLWNCYSFSVRYMILDKYDPSDRDILEADLSIEDQWIISSADNMIEHVRDGMAKNEYHHVLAKLSCFIIEDLSRWYIKIIRDRLWLQDHDGKMNPSKKAAYVTLTTVLERVCVAMAPIAPFISEEIYQNLFMDSQPKSIHQVGWPILSSKVDEKLLANMNLARALFEAGSRCRQEANIKLRYPLRKVRITGDQRVKETVASLRFVILKQLNCKEAEFVDVLPDVSFVAKPNFAKIGPKYGKEANKVAAAIKANPQDAKKIIDESKPALIGGFEVTPEMIAEVKLTVPEKYTASAFSNMSSNGLVLIETARDQSLMNEALARELIRSIQEQRKRNNLAELQRIRIEVSQDKDVDTMLEEFTGTILHETRADSITVKVGLEAKDSLKTEGKDIKYAILF
jgi:isoleucyl-tRNA synthetase